MVGYSALQLTQPVILALFWGLLLQPAEFSAAGPGLLPTCKGPHSVSPHLDVHRHKMGISYTWPHIKISVLPKEQRRAQMQTRIGYF